MEDYRGAEQGRLRRARPTAFLLRESLSRVGHSAARTTGAGGAGSVTPSCTSRCVGLTVARIDFARATSPAVPWTKTRKESAFKARSYSRTLFSGMPML